MISAMQSAALGIGANLQLLDKAADRIAHHPLGSDLAANLMQLKTAQHGVSLNAQVMRTADDVLGVLIDTFA